MQLGVSESLSDCPSTYGGLSLYFLLGAISIMDHYLVLPARMSLEHLTKAKFQHLCLEQDKSRAIGLTRQLS